MRIVLLFLFVGYIVQRHGCLDPLGFFLASLLVFQFFCFFMLDVFSSSIIAKMSVVLSMVLNALISY